MSAFPSAPTPHLEPEYWTAEDVGALLKVEPSTVYGWAKKYPDMPMVKVGHTVRFPRARLLEWLRAREQGRPPMRKRLRSEVANQIGKFPDLQTAEMAGNSVGTPPPTEVAR